MSLAPLSELIGWQFVHSSSWRRAELARLPLPFHAKVQRDPSESPVAAPRVRVLLVAWRIEKLNAKAQRAQRDAEKRNFCVAWSEDGRLAIGSLIELALR